MELVVCCGIPLLGRSYVKLVGNMSEVSLFSVITTIQRPTEAVLRLSRAMKPIVSRLVIVGDRKGPDSYAGVECEFLSIDSQLRMHSRLAPLLPVGHYARKNLGYIHAIHGGADCIYETDDDNAPMPCWAIRSLSVSAHRVLTPGWVNAYRQFTTERIWPRGLPLNAVAASCEGSPVIADLAEDFEAPIQQALANNSPDVDAVWRLVMDRPFDFNVAPSIFLPVGSWCPFNSQSTWWWPVAYPLMYLPSFCSFRMTDIWRSFIAQRCLWELGRGVVFHSAEVVQERNPHNLMRDFNDEIPGYQKNEELVQRLMGLSLDGGAASVGGNLYKCYSMLVSAGFFPESELALVNAWLADFGLK
jgi:STELLO glycosyltransferases